MTSPAPALRRPDGAAVRILVVDDEQMLTDLLSMALRMEGWDVRTAASGFEALQSVRDFEPDAIVASFHGMPERTLHLGDPYHCQCVKSARLLSEAIGRPVEIAFQSRFGRAKWLEPATDALLERLGREGRRVAIFAPGFSADCLETLEELAIRGKEQFEAAGGRDFAYLGCLNDTPPGMAMLEALVRRELTGWH